MQLSDIPALAGSNRSKGLASLSVSAFRILPFLLALTLNAFADKMTYRTRITGIRNLELRRYLQNNISTGKKLRLTSENALRRQIERDSTELIAILKNQGYYAGSINISIIRKKTTVRVIFHTGQGSPYLLESAAILLAGGNTDEQPLLPKLDDLGIELHKRVRTKAITSTEAGLLTAIRNQGFPFVNINETRLTIDHAAKTAMLQFDLDPGKRARFGATYYDGLSSVNESFLDKYIPWDDGELFSEKKLNDFHQRLIGTELFAFVRESTETEPDSGGNLPIVIIVKERKHRTRGLGVSAGTDEGFGGKLYWEHRNIRHRGNRLRFAFDVSTNAFISDSGTHVTLETTYKRPHFFLPSQSLILNLKPAFSYTPAYKILSSEISATIERILKKGVTLNWGVSLQPERVLSKEESPNYGLMALPATFHRDTRNDILDPFQGSSFLLELAPFFNLVGRRIAFGTIKATYSGYVRILKRPSLIFAGRLRIGSMYTGGTKEFSDIPDNHRFYGGGGGSIRGYKYQSASPSDSSGPVGGKSLAELSLEFRIKPFRSVGFVMFIDGGGAYPEKIPKPFDYAHIGAGGGLRIFTTFAPIRFDIGLPVSHWKPINDFAGFFETVRFYFGLGQAF